jgi:hypothetical protein
MTVGKPALLLALDCPKCGAASGQPCIRLNDGGQRVDPHVRRTPLAPCGTFGGYQRHKKAKEEACDQCRDAQRRYTAEWRKKTPKGQADREMNLVRLRARREATKRLIAQHRSEFHALLTECESEVAS